MKRIYWRAIPAALALCVVLGLFGVKARAAEETIEERIARATDFMVVYFIEDKQITVGRAAAATWLVTSENVDQLIQDRSAPGSGLYLVGGRETQLPAQLRTEKGYITDGAGNPIFSEALMYRFLEALFAPYGASGAYAFVTTAGNLIQVEGVTLKGTVQLNEELAYLKNVVLFHISEGRIPVSGIGNTYVEVDMTGQQLYFYQNGEQKLSTPIVTGKTSGGRGTPTGAYAIYAKQTNRTLRGADYEAFVRYWMPFYKAYGLHDASWRKSFGGEIYKKNGSHGCVNMPSDAARQLYELAPVGTPVILYY